MSDAAQKKDEFKKHVRALLLSCPAALTVRELERDFYNFIGVRLAYRDIGYATIEDFLRDIDDAVQISYKNGVMTLTANADDTTKHIQRLVSRQKVSNKQKYAVYRNRGGGGPPRMYQGNNRYPRRSASNLAPPQPMVPAYVRRQIKDLFRSFPNGIPVTHLDSAFSRMYGTGINYRHYGFQNQYEFLQSLKDIIKVEEVERGEWRVFPVDNIGNREPRELPPRLQAKVNNQHNMQTSQENYQATQPVQHSAVQGQHQPQESNRRRRPSKGRGRRRENSGDSDIVVGQDARSVSSTSSHNEDHLEQEIQQVLEKNPGGIWANQFPKEFEAVHGRQLDYREHGYLSVIDFLSAMPDTVGTVRPNPRGDWMVYDARLPEPGKRETKKQRSPHNSGGQSTESEVKETIQTILNSRPYGVPVKKFPEVFKEYTGRNLPLSELGFDSSEDLCLAMEDSIIQLAYNGNEMIMYSIDIEMSVTDRESSPTPPPPGIPNSEDYPADAVGPGCHFVPLILPNPEQYVELYVTNVVNPGLFWVMLRHRTKSLALEYLMDQLDEAYNKDRDMDIYRMPEDLMVPGQVCATLFPEDNNWHRGVITGSNDKGFIEIYYVDYGNTNFVQKNMIRFLKAEFLTLPAQAVQARLANTHPPSGVNGKWKNKSRSRLLELTCHRPLVAYICDVKSQKMSLCLTDTNQSDVDIHINDVMVNDGLAIFKPDAEVDAPADTNKHLMHLAPQHWIQKSFKRLLESLM
ncbi:tudor domain-containing protein 5-like [Ruditapes philippinarum]|uniref:tudor domain-containing protein 5-like n=1 Tax=Ruditapes philippinarum TaxID=129788 RepID=UPI00295B9FE5|nr:tudor domain-containing protein 5-like [Ruditapes philippinarum]